MYSVLLLESSISGGYLGLKTPGLDNLTRGTVDRNRLD